MPLFDIFKKKKTESSEEKIEKSEKKPKAVKKEKKKIEKKIEVKETVAESTEKSAPASSKTIKKDMGAAYQILSFPHITEKASILGEKNKYIFSVFPRANKKEIKKAVEGTYGVEVVGVRIINIKGKKRRMGKHEGWSKGQKKAIVEVKKGQKIEILPR